MASKRRELKKEVGIAQDMPFIAPTFSGNMEHIKDESLMLFSYSKHKGKRYRLFYGIGVVYRVVKGDKNDLIYVNFGGFSEHKTRLVIAYDNHSRRQTLTLKRGQVCQVYGICRFYTKDMEINGVKTTAIRLGLYAKGILGWYVPKMMDIRKMPVNEDIVAPTESEEEVMDFLGKLEEEWKEN